MADTAEYDEKREALGELVHEQASEIASNAINSGEEIDFLLSHGWTLQDIDTRLVEMTTPTTPENDG